jgi:hypothetical protein
MGGIFILSYCTVYGYDELAGREKEKKEKKGTKYACILNI